MEKAIFCIAENAALYQINAEGSSQIIPIRLQATGKCKTVSGHNQKRLFVPDQCVGIIADHPSGITISPSGSTKVTLKEWLFV